MSSSEDATLDNLEEEYYQINLDILQSFNKFRPPLDIFRLKEDVVRIYTYYTVGGRLSTQQTEELPLLVEEGLIFVSRKDHHIYAKHISFQLDLVLQDKHLKEGEIADIFQIALTRRLTAFYEQPVKPVFEKLQEDVLVLTQYLWDDLNRAKALARRLHNEHSLANHSVNCGFLGLMLFLADKADDFRSIEKNRLVLDRVALGLFLHDIGMSKIPPFIRDKTQALTPEERQKIYKHPNLGYELLTKLDLRFSEIEQCVLQHHERQNGSGYPQKLTAQNISHLGNLAAAVDSYCAMLTKRPYAEAMEPQEALRTVCSDTRYDPEVTKLLYRLLCSKG